MPFISDQWTRESEIGLLLKDFYKVLCALDIILYCPGLIDFISLFKSVALVGKVVLQSHQSLPSPSRSCTS